MGNRPRTLLEQVRFDLRLRHYSPRTEEAYVSWIRRYIIFHGNRHPRTMGKPEIEAFLSDLAIRGKVSASTQNQAFNALVFLYREVLKKDVEGIIDSIRAKKPKRLMECLRLRVKDIDLAMNRIVIRDGKGQKDRVTVLPETVMPPRDALYAVRSPIMRHGINGSSHLT